MKNYLNKLLLILTFLPSYVLCSSSLDISYEHESRKRTIEKTLETSINQNAEISNLCDAFPLYEDKIDVAHNKSNETSNDDYHNLNQAMKWVEDNNEKTAQSYLLWYRIEAWIGLRLPYQNKW